ncbi:MAG: hypothetical protein NXH95_14330 [Pseudomonadaceae bacterium]|nr:hypothetical protein [Pseudomonadaceae bacterium]
MRFVSKISFYILVVFSVTAISAAQAGQRYPYDDATLRQYAQAVQNTFTLIVERTAPLLPTEQSALLKRTQLIIELDNWDIYGAVQKEVNGRPAIVIPIGLVMLQDFVDTAIALSNLAGVPNDRTMGYVSEFLDRVRLNNKLHEVGIDATYLPYFPAYSGLPESTIQHILSTDEFIEFKELIKISTFGFLTLHEFAHVLNPNEHYKTRETSADLFAVSYATKADLSPILSLFSFLFFAGIEGEENLTKASATHQSAMCRGVEFFKAGVDAAEAEPDFRSVLRSQGTLREWDRSVRDMKDMLESGELDCPEPDLSRKPQALTQPARKTPEHYQAKIWRPTPGVCNGVKFDLYVNKEFVETVNNTSDSSNIELEDLKSGTHLFEFDEITAWCINKNPPFRMQIVFRDRQCQGTFRASNSSELQVFVEPDRFGALRCGIY